MQVYGGCSFVPPCEITLAFASGQPVCWRGSLHATESSHVRPCARAYFPRSGFVLSCRRAEPALDCYRGGGRSQHGPCLGVRVLLFLCAAGRQRAGAFIAPSGGGRSLCLDATRLWRFCRVHCSVDVLDEQSAVLSCSALFWRGQRAICGGPAWRAPGEQQRVLPAVCAGMACSDYRTEYHWTEARQVAKQCLRDGRVDFCCRADDTGLCRGRKIWPGDRLFAASTHPASWFEECDLLVHDFLCIWGMRDGVVYGRGDQRCAEDDSAGSDLCRSCDGPLLYCRNGGHAGGAAQLFHQRSAGF